MDNSLQQYRKLWIILKHFSIPWRFYIKINNYYIFLKNPLVTIQMDLYCNYHSETTEFLNDM